MLTASQVGGVATLGVLFPGFAQGVFWSYESRLPDAKNLMGNYTVWPVVKSLHQVSSSFPLTLTADETTHRFIWSRDRVKFRSLQGHCDDDCAGNNAWIYSPREASQYISQQRLPVHINLWLFKGLAPKNGREVEVIIRDFKFTPEPLPPTLHRKQD